MFTFQHGGLLFSQLLFSMPVRQIHHTVSVLSKRSIQCNLSSHCSPDHPDHRLNDLVFVFSQGIARIDGPVYLFCFSSHSQGASVTLEVPNNVSNRIIFVSLSQTFIFESYLTLKSPRKQLPSVQCNKWTLQGSDIIHDAVCCGINVLHPL
jgi:hypothetical protein